MITRISTINELKQIYAEILLNKTNKITKVADQSIVNGVAYGVAKVAQKALKDIALVETHLFPDYAFGQHLDDIAQKNGIAPRFGASSSSTYLRLVADVGTIYLATTNKFIGSGILYELTEDITIGSEGYVYAKVRSESIGSKTNLSALSINKVTPTPSGHIFVTNEYEARGGRDSEDDTSFRIRIKEGANVASRTTLSYITQVMMKFNTDVLRVYNYGVNAQNQSILAIATQNGIDLTVNELSELLDNIKGYLSLTDYNSTTNASIGVELRNVEYQQIDISFRAELIQTISADEIRKNIQIQISKYLDFRYWNPNQKVEWDDLLQIIKSNSNVKYVADSFFFPNQDIQVEIGKVPRIRGFIMLDLDGNLIEDNSGILDPIFYPNNIDFSFQQTVL
jgi:hypothetical protein